VMGRKRVTILLAGLAFQAALLYALSFTSLFDPDAWPWVAQFLVAGAVPVVFARMRITFRVACWLAALLLGAVALLVGFYDGPLLFPLPIALIAAASVSIEDRSTSERVQ
jgi:hypothetical protein